MSRLIKISDNALNLLSHGVGPGRVLVFRDTTFFDGTNSAIRYLIFWIRQRRLPG